MEHKAESKQIPVKSSNEGDKPICMHAFLITIDCFGPGLK